MKLLLVRAAIALGLAAFLVFRSPSFSKRVYQIAFFIGLATLGSVLFSAGSMWTFSLSGTAAKNLSIVPISFLAATPWILLIEIAVAGNRGFSPWFRYISYVLSALGVTGLIATFLLPRLRTMLSIVV